MNLNDKSAFRSFYAYKNHIKIILLHFSFSIRQINMKTRNMERKRSSQISLIPSLIPFNFLKNSRIRFLSKSSFVRQ